MPWCAPCLEIALMCPWPLLVVLVVGSVGCGPQPVARLHIPACVLSGEVVNADGSSSDGASRPLERFRWDFGDGSPALIMRSPVVQHAYPATGVFDVGLTVTTDADVSATTVATLIVHSPGTECEQTMDRPTGVDAQGVPCAVTVSPEVRGGPFGGFQSQAGTGAQGTVNIEFSCPVASVRVTALDPDFPGNTMTALDAQGAVLDTVEFQGDNTPGTLTRDTQRVRAPGITRISLVAAPREYIAYDDVRFTSP